MRIPVANLKPALDRTEFAWKANLEALFRRMHFILGEEVSRFETAFAEHSGARFGIGVGTGPAAIELCLRAAGVSNGQEVLTTALTAPFSGIGILAAGCRIRFADVLPDTLLLSPASAEEHMGRRCAAVMPVHLYGQPANLPAFARLARSHGLTLVQDACQAHGASYNGRPFTRFSAYVAYSFYPTKNLGCLGDGGAILTDRSPLAAKLRGLRDGGRRGGQVSVLKGINSRLDEMQACFLNAFLPMLDEWNAERKRIAALYDEGLADCDGVRLLRREPGGVNHLYVIRAKRREALRKHLAGHGIGTLVHYPVPLHLQPAFRDCGLKRGALPVAEKACREVLSLPLWPYMPESETQEVIERIRSFYG
jgi:dTDP-3-amino-3,4,6-trideoxy-alpha-D-glucose transaminase